MVPLTCVVLALAAVAAPRPPAPERLARLRHRAAVATAGPRVPARAVDTAVVTAAAVAGLLALGPVGALAGGAVTWRWWRRRRGARVTGAAAAVAVELADALGRITEELRAGAHPAAALAGVAADGPLARAVLGPAATAATLGDGIPAALAAAAEHHPGVARELRRVAGVWALADRHGVPPADLLSAALADLRRRHRTGRRVRALMAGPRATGAVLTALPALGIALGELVGAGPLAVLRSGVLGQALVAVGFGLVAAGAVWTERLTGTAGSA